MQLPSINMLSVILQCAGCNVSGPFLTQKQSICKTNLPVFDRLTLRERWRWERTKYGKTSLILKWCGGQSKVEVSSQLFFNVLQCQKCKGLHKAWFWHQSLQFTRKPLESNVCLEYSLPIISFSLSTTWSAKRKVDLRVEFKVSGVLWGMAVADNSLKIKATLSCVL